MVCRFDKIPERDGRTDGQTDIIDVSILRVSVVTRYKNHDDDNVNGDNVDSDDDNDYE